jgi:hypothetical protein
MYILQSLKYSLSSPLLKELANLYRKLVVKSFKITYRKGRGGTAPLGR